MPKHNPNETPEMIETTDKAWAELNEPPGSTGGFTYIDNSELPVGYYLYSEGGKTDTQAKYMMLYAVDGAAVINSIQELIRITREAISDGGSVCRMMMRTEVMKAVSEDDAAAKRRVETIYMPALGLKTYAEAQRITVMDSLNEIMGSELSESLRGLFR